MQLLAVNAKPLRVHAETIFALYVGTLPIHQEKHHEFIQLVNKLSGQRCTEHNIPTLLYHAHIASEQIRQIVKNGGSANLRRINNIVSAQVIPRSKDNSDLQHWVKEALIMLGVDVVIEFE